MDIQDMLILQAVRSTRAQWTDLLEPSDAKALDGWLAQAESGDPEAVRQAANRTLDLLSRYPQARGLVTGTLGFKGSWTQFRSAYSPTPGGPDAIPVGTLMVCPVDPTHHRKWLRQKGKVLRCPEHDVPLVPAESLKH